MTPRTSRLSSPTNHRLPADARNGPDRLPPCRPGQAHDAPAGQSRLLRRLEPERTGLPLLMDRAYEGDETRQLALELGFTPVVPPKSFTELPPGTSGLTMCWPAVVPQAQRGGIRLFRYRLKAFRRVFTRRLTSSTALFLGRLHPLRAHRGGTPIALTRPSTRTGDLP